MLTTSDALYRRYALSRIYYSAFSPIPHASRTLPPRPPPLQREHRLYQADWLLRYYDFSIHDIVSATNEGMLDLDVDPKLAWALRNRHLFPVDVNRADRELLLRVPGLGARAVDRIMLARSHTTLRLADVGRVTASLKRARPFLVTPDWRPVRLADRADLRQRLVRTASQTDLFLGTTPHRARSWRGFRRLSGCSTQVVGNADFSRGRDMGCRRFHVAVQQ